jgi:hypothetical protein
VEPRDSTSRTPPVDSALSAGASVDERLVARVVEEAWRLTMDRADGPADPSGDGRVDLKHRRRLVKAATLGTAMAITFAGAAAAGVTYLHARTGASNTGWQVFAGGPGENLRKDAADYASTLEELAADIPFAPGYAESKKSALTTGYLAPAEDGVISTGAARAQLAQDAICTWADYWVASDVAAREADRSRAADALSGATGWAAVRAVDASSDPRGAERDQGPTETRFGWLPAIVAATRSHDVHAVSDAVRTSQRCDPAMTPTVEAQGR